MRLGTLVRIEAIKSARRPAVWVAASSLAGLLLLLYGGMSYRHMTRPHAPAFSLPNAWALAVGGQGNVGAFMTAVVLALLVTSEFNWKTGRQNVIDGLSKEQFFASKVLALPAAALLFLAVPLLMAAAVGALQTPAGTVLVRHGDALLFAGGFARNLGYGAVALLIAFATRNSGGATGLFFLWVIAEGIISGPLSHLHPLLANLEQYMPLAVFNAISDDARYRAVQPHPLLLSNATLAALAGAWILLLIGASYLTVRRRDL